MRKRPTPWEPKRTPFEDALRSFESDVAKAELPETILNGGAPLPFWAKELGVEFPCGLHELKRAFRRAVLRAHPDCGGSHEEFLRVQTLYTKACAELDMPAPSVSNAPTHNWNKGSGARPQGVRAYA